MSDPLPVDQANTLRVSTTLWKALFNTSSMVGLPPASGSFGQSAHLADHYAFVPESEIRSALQQFSSLIGLSDQSIYELSKHKVHRSNLNEFLYRLPWVTQKAGEDLLGAEARRYFAAQVVFDLLPNRTKNKAKYPPPIKGIFESAAEGLFAVGKDQFLMLGKVCCDLVTWAVGRGCRSIAIIESPLGNSVPSQVLAELSRRQGLNAAIVEWGCPRHDREIKASARLVAAHQDVMQADLVLYCDDALTGTRLVKMSRALRGAVGKERCAVVAMRFQFAAKSGVRPFPRRDLSEVVKWANEQGLPHDIVDFPDIPLFSVDDYGPVYLETALSWGDVDIIAGKRKVNLVFNIIDHYENIMEEMLKEDSYYIKVIETKLWNRDAEGRIFGFAPGLVKKLFRDMIAKVDRRSLFQAIRSSAKSNFPNDFLGFAFNNSEAELRARSKWLDSCIREAAEPLLGPQRAGCLSRAICEIHQGGFDAEHRKLDSNRSYGHYTLPWHDDIRALNAKLRELIVDHAPCSL